MVNWVGTPEAPQKSASQCPAVKVRLNLIFTIKFTGKFSGTTGMFSGVTAHGVCTCMESQKYILGNSIKLGMSATGMVHNDYQTWCLCPAKFLHVFDAWTSTYRPILLVGVEWCVYKCLILLGKPCVELHGAWGDWWLALLDAMNPGFQTYCFDYLVDAVQNFQFTPKSHSYPNGSIDKL